MVFEEALGKIRNGVAMQRGGQRPQNRWFLAMHPAQEAAEGKPAQPKKLMAYTAMNDVVPWVASQADLLAEDWEEVPGQKAA